ncbi:MAG: glycosyltransferase family 9 protein [Candidatus Omnitrophica bacterium]|nr:glycosyltransferase family 9 protein [Candidatus Omnitrophota bacterium]
MNIELARKLDYYLGIFLCRILSVFCRIKGLRVPAARKIPIHPKKVLFIELCEMGSIILGYPAFIELKKYYPKVDIYFLTFHENIEAVLCSGVISERNIIGIRNKSIVVLLFDLWRSIRKLRRIGVDTVIDMNFFFRVSAVLSYLSNASIRVGFYQKSHKGLYRGNMQTHKVLYDPGKHIKNNYISLVNALKSDKINLHFHNHEQSEISNATRIDTADIEAMRDRLRIFAPGLDLSYKLVLINLGEVDRIRLRKWPMRNYNKLIAMLLEHEKIFIVMVGKGHPGCEQLIRHARCMDLIDKTNIRDMLSLCNLARVLVSHDCGMIHIASLTDIFICALFGPETPKLYAPISENMKIFYKELSCSPCLSAYNHKTFSCVNNNCLSEIKPEEVYACLIEQIF